MRLSFTNLDRIYVVIILVLLLLLLLLLLLFLLLSSSLLLLLLLLYSVYSGINYLTLYFLTIYYSWHFLFSKGFNKFDSHNFDKFLPKFPENMGKATSTKDVFLVFLKNFIVIRTSIHVLPYFWFGTRTYFDMQLV